MCNGSCQLPTPTGRAEPPLAAGEYILISIVDAQGVVRTEHRLASRCCQPTKPAETPTNKDQT